METEKPSNTTLNSCPGNTTPSSLSKNQLKKQRKFAQMVELRKVRRQKERERKKEKKAVAKANGLPLRDGPSRKELKRRQMSASSCQSSIDAVNVAIDLDYDDLMQERDIAKCVKQCLRIYTINRRAVQPLRLHFTGIKRDGRIHACLKKNDGWENWQVDYQFDCTHIDLWDNQRIVYLTCESDTVLEKPLPGYMYVIGGLVDHNHFKGLCHQRATTAGLKTARLPLSEHVDMKTRSVLSTYHVFEMLTRVAAGQDWTAAILETIPQRKGAKAKENKSSIKDRVDHTNGSCEEEPDDQKEKLSTDS